MRVLLIEDSPKEVRRLRDTLGQLPDGLLQMEWADDLETGLERLSAEKMDAILLDLSLPGCQGLEAYDRTHAHVTDVPVVVLADHADDEGLSLEAVKRGAQDYLVKGQFNAELLRRVLRYAIERHHMQQTLRNLSLIDEVTALYNRYGFVTLAEHQLKLAFRTQKGLLLFVAELDNLTELVELLGAEQADAALVRAADVLRESFRTSDVLARLNRNQFMALATEAPSETVEIMYSRLIANLVAHNQSKEARYRLRFSVGVAAFDPKAVFSLDALMALAYRDLMARKNDEEGGA